MQRRATWGNGAIATLGNAVSKRATSNAGSGWTTLLSWESTTDQIAMDPLNPDTNRLRRFNIRAHDVHEAVLKMNLARKIRRATSADQLSFVFADTQARPSTATRPRGPEPDTGPINQAVALVVAEPKPASPTKKIAKRSSAPQSVAQEDRRLTVEEAAAVLSVSVKTLEAWRRLGKGPVFVKLGRSVRYTMPALDQFTRDRTVRNSAEGRMLDARR